MLSNLTHWNQLTFWPAGGRRVSLLAVGRALYYLVHHKMDRASSIRVVSKVLPLLLQAGCLADNRALHMSSVLYSAGLGVKKNPSKVCMLLCQLLLKYGHQAHFILSFHAPVYIKGLAPGPAGSTEGWPISTSASWECTPPRSPWLPNRPRPGLCILCKYRKTDYYRPSKSYTTAGNGWICSWMLLCACFVWNEN